MLTRLSNPIISAQQRSATLSYLASCKHLTEQVSAGFSSVANHHEEAKQDQQRVQSTLSEIQKQGMRTFTLMKNWFDHLGRFPPLLESTISS